MTPNGLHPFEALLRERIVVLDGAMGTMIQQCNSPKRIIEESDSLIGRAKTSREVSNYSI